LEPRSFRDIELARKALSISLKDLLDHSGNDLLQRTKEPALYGWEKNAPNHQTVVNTFNGRMEIVCLLTFFPGFSLPCDLRDSY